MPYKCYFLTFRLLGKDNECQSPAGIHQEVSYYTNPILDEIPILFRPPLTERYLPIFENIFRKALERDRTSALILKSNILQLLYNLHEDAQAQLHAVPMLLSQHYVVLKKIALYIENNYDKKISLTTLSKVCNLSPNYFHRIFKKAIGMTPNEYIAKIRIDKSKELLVTTGMPISEIAVKCGFENIPYFSYVFKTMLGISPGEFRKMHSYM